MKRKARPHEHQGEINIVPYLDIMVNLVMFMLMSMTGFISFQMINSTMPDAADATAQVDPSTPPPEQKDQFTLNVSIGAKGFYIAATGGVLPGEAPADPNADPDSATPTIPLKDGAYDYEALQLKMASIKKAYPHKTDFLLAADRTVKYDVIIQTMDATRGDAQNPMFPDVAFSAIY